MKYTKYIALLGLVIPLYSHAFTCPKNWVCKPIATTTPLQTIQDINNAAATKALADGSSHQWVTPPEMFNGTTSTQESSQQIDEENQQKYEASLPWCGNLSYNFRNVPCNSAYLKKDN
jgi:hypothetical protein